MRHLRCDLERTASNDIKNICHCQSKWGKNLMWAFKIIYCAVMCLHIIDKDDNGKVIDMEYMYIVHVRTNMFVHIFMSQTLSC